MKLSVLLIPLTFLSCTLSIKEETDFKEKRVINTSENSLVLLDGSVIEDSSFILDKYPIPSEVEIFENDEDFETARPKQLFSALSSSEIRLHKLGEIRWVYLGLEPSAAWPMTIQFIENNEEIDLGTYDVSQGTINSKIYELNNFDSKFVFKIERGLQQSSSEIFVSQLKRVNNNWVIVSSKESQLDNLINEFYNYLSEAGPSTGTSLVALNLNASNKTEVISDEISGMSKIKLKINFARAWAALRRSLQIAGYKILDEDRNGGKFFLEYSLKRSLLDRRPDITSVEILVEELSSKECLISTNLDEENIELSEEIISQINQSLS